MGLKDDYLEDVASYNHPVFLRYLHTDLPHRRNPPLLIQSLSLNAGRGNKYSFVALHYNLSPVILSIFHKKNVNLSLYVTGFQIIQQTCLRKMPCISLYFKIFQCISFLYFIFSF
jgi:hypothetical protein